jgi:hypothetical protein
MSSTPTEFEGAHEGSPWFEGGGLRSTDGFAMSRAKTFRGMVIHPDAIFVSLSTSLLYLQGT